MEDEDMTTDIATLQRLLADARSDHKALLETHTELIMHVRAQAKKLVDTRALLARQTNLIAGIHTLTAE